MIPQNEELFQETPDKKRWHEKRRLRWWKDAANRLDLPGTSSI